MSGDAPDDERAARLLGPINETSGWGTCARCRTSDVCLYGPERWCYGCEASEGQRRLSAFLAGRAD